MTMLSVLVCSANIFAIDTVKDAITSITSEANWDEQIYELNDLFDEESDTPLDASTQQSLAALVTTIFNGRLALYKSSMGTNVNLADLNLMLINAQKSTLLTTAQQAVASGYQQLVVVEQLILQNQSEKNYTQQVNNAASALGSAGASTFDPLIQSFFLQQLATIYTGRTTQSEAIQERLNSVFTRAKTSTLIGNTNKADIATKSDILTTESSLRKATKDPVYSSALKILTTLQTQDQTKKFEPFTQNLNFNTLSQIFNTRDNRNTEEITGLISLLTQATTTPLLNPEQQAKIAAMLASLSIEKSIIEAIAKNSFAEKLKALQDITSANASAKPSTNAQKLYSMTMQGLFGTRPANNLQANNDLITLFTSAQTSPLLADVDKAIIATWLSTLQTETANLTVQSDIQKALAQETFAAKVSDINAVLSNNTGKTVSDDTKSQVATGVNQLITSRPKNDVDALNKLNALFAIVAGSSLLTDGQKAQIAAQQAQIGADLANAILAKQLQDILANPDYNARTAALQKFMADNAGKTLTPEMQAALQKGLQDLIDNRPVNDPAALTNLANLLNSAGTSNLLSPDFKTQLTATLLPAVNADKDKAGIDKSLQEALANPDYNARLNGLQKFAADNAGKTLSPGIQTALQGGLQALATNRPPNDVVALSNLAGMLSALGSSNLLSPDFKNQLTSSLLPAINADKDKAGMNKSLQEALANPDYNTRLNGLQKFAADNAGKILTADMQNALQGGLQALAANRPTTDPTTLGSLAKTFGSLGNSNLLSPDFKNQLSGSLLPAINADHITAQLGTIGEMTDPKAQANALANFMNNNIDKTLTTVQQKTLQGSLQQAIGNRAALDTASLGALANATQNGAVPGLVGADGVGIIKQTLLPTLQAGLPGANGALGNLANSGLAGAAGSTLNSAAALQNPNKLNSATIPGASSSTDLTGAQGSNTAGLMSSGLKAPTQLSAMPGLQGTSGTTGAIPGSQNLTALQNANQLNITSLPGANTAASKQNQSALGSMPSISNTPSAQGSNPSGLNTPAKLGSMPGSSQAASNKAGGLAQNQQALTGLQSPVDLTGMPGSQAPVQGSDSQQAQPGILGTQMADQVGQGAEATEEQLIQEINRVMALPALKDRLLGINNVLANGGNRMFTDALQRVYAQAIQQLFDTRAGDPAAQQAQIVALSKTHKKTIVAKASSKQAKSRKAKSSGKKGKKMMKKNNAKKEKNNYLEAQATQSTTTTDEQPAHPASGKNSKKQRGAKK
jgi:hypothetical protein